jgi:hypothetical protein
MEDVKDSENPFESVGPSGGFLCGVIMLLLMALIALMEIALR